MDDHSKSQVKRLITQSPEYAAGYQAGREAGMREASEKLRDQEWIDRVLEASPDEMTCEEAYSFAILSAIGGDK